MSGGKYITFDSRNFPDEFCLFIALRTSSQKFSNKALNTDPK